ncbi:head GIN domain-containing protein [Lutimonas halocynthiae]|uniref:head GIN domain-containing protein n=1 Tax=Lutimonas halocynthiae TaxID=1446477 RepID=UPI0025B2F523|nr:head GIN domain-containing protein [Lutimonas halocynthiae]MDN3642865.1 head GIN domain-containing protein [Lutimonas halocynthiae]
MKKAILFSIFIALFIVSCDDDETYTGEGPIVTEELTLQDFSGIEAIGSMDIIILEGAEQKIEVTGHANIIERVETSVSNGIWKVKLKDGSYKNADLTFNIVIPMLNRASIEGSGDILINDFTSVENVYLGIIGSGNIQLDENDGCANLVVEIEGSGHVNAKEEFEDIESLDVEIIGSGSFDGFPVEADQVIINIVGSADCDVTANIRLKVDIDGSGIVSYKGNPTIDSNISGSGKIINAN